MMYRTLVIALVLTACGASTTDNDALDPTAGSAGTENAIESDDGNSVSDVEPSKQSPVVTATSTVPDYSILATVAGSPTTSGSTIVVAGKSSIAIAAGGSSAIGTVVVGNGGSVGIPLGPSLRGGSAGTIGGVAIAGALTTVSTLKSTLGGSASVATTLVSPVSQDTRVVCCLFSSLSTSCECEGSTEGECVAKVKTGRTRCTPAA